jgi:hypothetical protein
MLYADHTWHLHLIPVAVKCVVSPKRDGMTKGEMELHNEELHDLYCSPNIIWIIRWIRMGMGGACSTYERQERSVQGFRGEP